MTVRTSIQVHFSPGDVSHRHTPSYSTLDFGYLGGTDLMIHFTAPGQIDEVIAELTALRAEMAAEGAPKPVYRLTCGCTDGRCNCPGCQAGRVHQDGTGWHCDEHGKVAIAGIAAEVTA